MNINDTLARLTMIRSLILGFFFASLYYFFVYDSGTAQQNAIVAAQNQITQQQKHLQELSQKLDRAHEYQRSASEMGEALNKLLAYIPENFRLQDFMKVVSEEAKVAGLNILLISQSTSAGNGSGKRPDFEELVVNVQLQGSFAQIMTFLANLTKQKQIFTVEKFNMNRDSNGTADTDSPMLNFTADIKAYRYIGGKSKI